MRSSPLFPRASIASTLSLLSLVAAQSIPGASFYRGNGAPGAGPYQLIDDYNPSIFFNKFNFYNSYDPTYGHVQYVDGNTARQNGLVTTTGRNTAYIGVDYTNKWPPGRTANGSYLPGRPAVRIISENSYTHGLFIFDVAHMPQGCGTWPAYWLLAPDWPYNGEIDIIEGVNTQTSNTVSLHTNPGCVVTGTNQTGTLEHDNCDIGNDNIGCGSTMDSKNIPNNYGVGLNSIGGGVYATEWTSNYIKTWFFPRNAIPASITSGQPDVNTFGVPAVNQQGPGCPIDQHFNNMSIIINTDFCGAYAGTVYSSFTDCPQNTTVDSQLSCTQFVGNNPAYFKDAYWEINSIKVYQMQNGAVPTSSYSEATFPATPAASTNTVPMGMGGTSISSSVPYSYTGPLSSVTSSTATGSATAVATPAICPGTSNAVWTDYNGVNYTIMCGFDFDAAGPGPLYLASFEACLEVCDDIDGCTSVSYSGGNGAGVCYPKSGGGKFIEDGKTFSAKRADSGTPPSPPAPYSSSPSAAATIALPSPSSGPVEPACPSGNGTTYSDSAGHKFLIYCDTDSDPEGSIAISQQPDFHSCVESCGADAACGAAALVPVGDTAGGTCYLKYPPTSFKSSVGLKLAVKVVAAPNTSLIGVSSASSSAMTSSWSAAGTSTVRSSSSAGTPSTTLTFLTISSSSPVVVPPVYGTSTMPSPSSSVPSSTSTSSKVSSPSLDVPPVYGASTTSSAASSTPSSSLVSSSSSAPLVAPPVYGIITTTTTTSSSSATSSSSSAPLSAPIVITPPGYNTPTPSSSAYVTPTPSTISTIIMTEPAECMTQLCADYVNACGKWYGGCYPGCPGHTTPSFVDPGCPSTSTAPSLVVSRQGVDLVSSSSSEFLSTLSSSLSAWSSSVASSTRSSSGAGVTSSEIRSTTSSSLTGSTTSSDMSSTQDSSLSSVPGSTSSTISSSGLSVSSSYVPVSLGYDQTTTTAMMPTSTFSSNVPTSPSSSPGPVGYDQTTTTAMLSSDAVSSSSSTISSVSTISSFAIPDGSGQVMTTTSSSIGFLNSIRSSLSTPYSLLVPNGYDPVTASSRSSLLSFTSSSTGVSSYPLTSYGPSASSSLVSSPSASMATPLPPPVGYSSIASTFTLLSFASSSWSTSYSADSVLSSSTSISASSSASSSLADSAQSSSTPPSGPIYPVTQISDGVLPPQYSTGLDQPASSAYSPPYVPPPVYGTSTGQGYSSYVGSATMKQTVIGDYTVTYNPGGAVPTAISSSLAPSSSSAPSSKAAFVSSSNPVQSRSASSTRASIPAASSTARSSSIATVSKASQLPAPPCPPSPSAYCAGTSPQTTCQSGGGNNYAVQCGVVYIGTVIPTDGISEYNKPTLVKRATTADLAGCQQLCDSISGCVAFNYLNTNCTLLSSVSGYSYTPGALGGQQVQGTAVPSPAPNAPVCPGSAGKAFVDSTGASYNIVCYTEFPQAEIIGTPFASTNVANCLPACDANSTCAGVTYNTNTGLCTLRRSFQGTQTSDTGVIAALRAVLPPSYVTPSISVAASTVTTTLPPPNTATATLSSGQSVTIPASSAPVAVVNVSVTVTAPATGSFSSGPSGSFYVYTSTSTGPSVQACICYDCAITPVITYGPCSTPVLPVSTPVTINPPPPQSFAKTCSARPATVLAVGTTTVFTTHTVTTCGPQPTCPALGYFIYGGSATQPGQQVITTTGSNGAPITYTQIPAGPTTTPGGYGGNGGGGNGNGNGPGTGPGTGLGTGPGTGPGTGFDTGPPPTQTLTTTTTAISYVPSTIYGVSTAVSTYVSNGITYQSTYGVSTAIGVTSVPVYGGPGIGPGTGPGTGAGTGPGTGFGTGPGTGPGPTQTETTTSRGPTTTAPGGAISTAAPTCPASNNTVYSDDMGKLYRITCNLVYGGEDVDVQTQDTFKSCVASCDMYNIVKAQAPACAGVTYYSTQKTLNCFLKRSVNQVIYSEGGGSGEALNTATPGQNQTVPGPGTEYGSMTAPPVTATVGTGPGTGPGLTQTLTTTTTTTAISYVPSTIYSVRTEYSTYISNGVWFVTQYGVSTAISVSLVPAPTVTATAISYVPSTVYSVRTTVSTYVSNGVSYVTSYGISTAISVVSVPAPTQTLTTTTTVISYVPLTVYSVRTTVSTYISNGISYVTSYGISTAISVSLVPAPTQTIISISIVPGATVTQGSGPGGYGGNGGGVVTVTETPAGGYGGGNGGYGGNGGGGATVTMTTGGAGVVTVTEGNGGSMGGTQTTTRYITVTVAPSKVSTSSSFTCRTYATNYNNGFHGRAKKRGMLEEAGVLSAGEEEPAQSKPRDAPVLWYNGVGSE